LTAPRCRRAAPKLIGARTIPPRPHYLLGLHVSPGSELLSVSLINR
jgi:hypothetical protein